MMARCVVCGAEFDVDPRDDAHFESFLASVTRPLGHEADVALGWPEDPIVLAVSCGPLVHPDDQVITAVRLHGGEYEGFYLFTREAA